MIDRLTKRFHTIREKLLPYSDIWSKEVLNYYPQSMENFPQDWVDEIVNLDDREQWGIDSKQNYLGISHPQLKQLFSELNQISDIESVHHFYDLKQFQCSATTFLGVKDKKKHELELLFSLFTELQNKHHFTSVTNIGGGVGHISRILGHHFLLPSNDIDMNAEFQQIGRNKLKLYPQIAGAPDINFVTLKLDQNTSDELLNSLFHSQTFAIGLHTCGELAVRQLQIAAKKQISGVLNFGCCYGLIENPLDTNISAIAKKSPLPLSPHALTLATRGHREASLHSFMQKKKVKAYRYALHLFNYHQLQISEFLTVGNGSDELYHGDFATYYQFMMKRLGADPQVSREDLNHFFELSDTQKLLARLFAMDLIRWQFGRSLELSILLDRAIFLCENGYLTQIFALFAEELSPRNIGLFAIKQ